MKRLVVAFFLLAFVVLLAGCGGSDTAATSSTTGAGAPGSGATAPGGATGVPGASGAPQASSSTSAGPEGRVDPVKFKVDSETPADLRKLLKAKRVVVVEFFTPGDPVTGDVAKEIAPLKKLFKKEVSFVTYDVNKAAKTGSVAEQLKTGYSPYFIIIDKQGYIVYRHSGYIDQMTLEQQIFSTLRR